MLTTQLEAGGSPKGLYGRAWLTGRTLMDAVSWERVKLLATSFDARGRSRGSRVSGLVACAGAGEGNRRARRSFTTWV